jgi:hypothetical protein
MGLTHLPARRRRSLPGGIDYIVHRNIVECLISGVVELLLKRKRKGSCPWILIRDPVGNWILEMEEKQVMLLTGTFQRLFGV